MSDATQHRRSRFAPRRPAGAPPSERSFRLSFLLLGVAISLALGVTSWIGLVGNDRSNTLEISDVRIAETGEVELTGARYRGVTPAGRPFEVTAAQANEAQDGSGRVDMILPTAVMTMRNGSVVNLRSNSGIYLKQADSVDLAGDVVVIQPDRSLRLDTESLKANLKSGEMHSNVPVEVTDSERQINAETMTVYNHGERIIFGGSAKMIIRPPSKTATKSSEKNS